MHQQYGLKHTPRPQCACLRKHTARRCWRPPPPLRTVSAASAAAGDAANNANNASSGDATSGDGNALAADFARHVAALGLDLAAPPRAPSPLLPPTAVVAAQLAALQRPDWPEPGSGFLTAFEFAMPYGCGGAATPRSRAAAAAATGAASPAPAHQLPSVHPGRRRSWGAKEEWVGAEEFAEALRAPPYSALVGCDAWRLCAPLEFLGGGSAGGGGAGRKAVRAVQAVEVVTAAAAATAAASGAPGSGSRGASSAISEADGGGGDSALQRQWSSALRYSFLLERAEVGGAKGCFLVIGVRAGDYSH